MKRRSIATDALLSREALDRIALELEQLRQELIAGEADLSDVVEAVHRDNVPSARNLAQYLALRRRDVRALQLRLARIGLSSLGRSESHVMVTLDRIITMLALARGAEPPDLDAPPVGFSQGERRLAANTRRLLGPRPRHRDVRIVVTLPVEVAEDPRFAYELIEAGMDCARINCGRDDADTWNAMAEHVCAARRALDRSCRILVDLGGPKLRTGRIAGGAKRLLLVPGDRFELVRERDGPPVRNGSMPRIASATDEIFRHVDTGQAIWFDDGKIGGIVEERTDEGFIVRVTTAKADGSKLRPERGINLPDTALDLPAISARDLRDLDAVIAWADTVELSFVQTRDDVLALHSALLERERADAGIVLKIETQQGFANLPQLLLAAMQRRSCGVMIARGDLAVEMGFERMAEVQEEILWIAEAAHVPTIWATQVLDDLAKEGMLSRAEMTDAAMSARAEAVMLNKGPFVIDAISTLDDILGRMKEHQSKKRSLLRALRVSRSLWE